MKSFTMYSQLNPPFLWPLALPKSITRLWPLPILSSTCQTLKMLNHSRIIFSTCDQIRQPMLNTFGGPHSIQYKKRRGLVRFVIGCMTSRMEESRLHVLQISISIGSMKLIVIIRLIHLGFCSTFRVRSKRRFSNMYCVCAMYCHLVFVPLLLYCYEQRPLDSS